MMRFMPPSNGVTTVRLADRLYTCPANGTIDVPDFDAPQLEANGWIPVANGGVGSTAQRPVNWTAAHRARQFHDTTLANNIIWDGLRWRNSDTGAVV
jgi:hypothetical protein